MSYPVFALISVVIFSLVHLFAEKTRQLDTVVHGKFLSIGGGVAIAYVFIDLLPKLSKSDQVVTEALYGIFPYFERHAYIMALAGFLLFFVVARSHTFLRGEGRFWLSLGSYALFNFLIGYAVVDKDNPEVRPLALFTFAMALHYFATDYSLTKEHGDIYSRFGRWVLIVCLYLGWITGLFFQVPKAAVAMISAFIGGGVIMNVIRYELPEASSQSTTAFLLGSFFYTLILLMVY